MLGKRPAAVTTAVGQLCRPHLPPPGSRPLRTGLTSIRDLQEDDSVRIRLPFCNSSTRKNFAVLWHQPCDGDLEI